MKRVASPNTEKRLNLTELTYALSHGSFSDEELHGHSMPDLEEDLLLFSDKHGSLRKKVVSPSGARSIKIVDDFEFESNVASVKPNKKAEGTSAPLLSPCRDNLEDSIKGRAETGRASPVFVFPKEGEREVGQKAITLHKACEDENKQGKASNEQTAENLTEVANNQVISKEKQEVEEQK